MVGPGLKKGIRLIKGVYPKVESQHMSPIQLEALIKYILMNPNKLSDIAKYIEKRVKKDLAKERYGSVEVSLEVINAILESCHSNHLTFYAPNVVNILHELFQLDKNINKHGNTGPITGIISNINRMKILAIETFRKFADIRYNNNVTEYQDLGFFVDYFVEMANNVSPNLEERKRIRTYGMRALYTYIRTVEDLDSFVAKYIESKDKKNKVVLSTILNNMLEYASEKEHKHGSRSDEPEEELNNDNIYSLCSFCLRELVRSASAITVQSLLAAVIDFLDSRQVWNVKNFARDCVKAISHKPQSNNLTFPLLVRHVEFVKDTAIKIAIVETIIFLAENSARGSIGSLIELLFHLVSQLVAATNVDNEQDIALEMAIVKCIGVVSRMAEANEKAAAMKDLIEKAKTEKKIKMSIALLKCVSQIATSCRDMYPAKINEIVEQLLFLSTNSNPEIRIYVLQIFQNLITTESRRNSVSLSLFKVDNTEQKRTEKRNDQIRASLLEQIQLSNNEPENFVMIFKIFNTLIQQNRSKEIEKSIAVMFKVENLCKENTLPIHLAYAAHSVVGAYFLLVSKLYSSSQLEEYATQVMRSRWSPTMMYEVERLEFLRVKKKFSRKKVPKPIELFFESDRIVELLSQIQVIRDEFGDNLGQVLFAKKADPLTKTLEEQQTSGTEKNDRRITIVPIPAATSVILPTSKSSDAVTFTELKALTIKETKEIEPTHVEVKVDHLPFDIITKRIEEMEGQKKAGFELLLEYMQPDVINTFPIVNFPELLSDMTYVNVQGISHDYVL